MTDVEPNSGAVMGDELAERLSAFGGAVVQLVESFPGNKCGKHIADQLFRSATSSGANYEEARGAHSRKEFIYRVSIALKELRESIS